jgi:hypothetical protein
MNPCSSRASKALGSFTVLLDLDGDCHDIVVELAVMSDFSGQTPVVGVGHCLL